jgi:hypothetical protein
VHEPGAASSGLQVVSLDGGGEADGEVDGRGGAGSDGMSSRQPGSPARLHFLGGSSGILCGKPSLPEGSFR